MEGKNVVFESTSEGSPPLEYRKIPREYRKLVAKILAPSPQSKFEIHSHKSGTFTALGFVFQAGIMVVADHSSKSSKSANNIVELNSHMIAAICGGSEFCLKELQVKCQEYEKMEGRKPLFAEVSEWLSKILLAYKEEDFPKGLLIDFYYEKEHGLYYMSDEVMVIPKFPQTKLLMWPGLVIALLHLMLHVLGLISVFTI